MLADFMEIHELVRIHGTKKDRDDLLPYLPVAASRGMLFGASNGSKIVGMMIAGPTNKPTGRDKTSVIFSVKDRVGALYDVLSPLAQHGISMNRIESRPAHTGKWQYAFFIDVSGHVDDEAMKAALDEMKPAAADVRVLGSYPVALP